ncbi:hypothetical protein GUJ93_ZPchr0002g25331 [Zizania palustris]|uniref:Secreted protein n=1 Tax=Zizania palustris TaxID=103762 RepID=A0A8J5VAN2_ZIZPA|nr:hypothetical protein GUJ93_ZPchr0002g25331 [Zizania palustris]
MCTHTAAAAPCLHAAMAFVFFAYAFQLHCFAEAPLATGSTHRTTTTESTVVSGLLPSNTQETAAIAGVLASMPTSQQETMYTYDTPS